MRSLKEPGTGSQAVFSPTASQPMRSHQPHQATFLFSVSRVLEAEVQICKIKSMERARPE